jgi:hypothetical protein
MIKNIEDTLKMHNITNVYQKILKSDWEIMKLSDTLFKQTDIYCNSLYIVIECDIDKMTICILDALGIYV